MTSLIRFLPNLLRTTQRIVYENVSNYHSKSKLKNIGNSSQTLVPGCGLALGMRQTTRIYFPRPSERKRIKRHGFWHRMSTVEGRRVLMRRFLKGRHVLSH